jgi:DNA-binding transcriptional ArsR family regulator
VIDARPSWTFLTNHAHVLLCLSRDPEVLMRDIADLVGITERAVQRIIADLEEAGHIARVRRGRRNQYEVRADLPLRHPTEQHVRVSALIDFVVGEGALARRRAGRHADINPAKSRRPARGNDAKP